jgi:3-oxoacyl-[acyl-carrier-protein] synthase II
MNSDAHDFVLPHHGRQAECIHLALERANLKPGDIDIVSSHATATEQGDLEEGLALHEVFGKDTKAVINNTKSFIGHAMGAAGALEMLGNLPSFDDGIAHATINLDNLDPKCPLTNIIANKPRELGRVRYILNNSFGMLGINSVVILKKYEGD